jgi:hypothetical protein
MATIEQKVSETLLFAQNGSNRPLHQDRQVLRASDLTLEQATQDQMLARARRYLHGWGVVSGFTPTVEERNVLHVGAGYGVTPLGDELFLPQEVTLQDAVKALILCCGPGPDGCNLIDPVLIAQRRAEAASITVTGWLIARPASRDASLRAGVPQDCTHPASILLPSRRCGGVEFAVSCTLPSTHQPRQPTCDELMPFVCDSERAGNPVLPWETLLPVEANFLVIGRLTVTGEGLAVTIAARRTLWPVSLIQDWIASCLCPVLSRNDTRPTIGGSVATVSGAAHGDTVSTRPATISGGVSGAVDSVAGSGVPIDVIRQPPSVVVSPASLAGPTPPVKMDDIRDRLTDPVSEITGVGAARSAALANAGIKTQGDFITAPVDTLATAMNLPATRVTAMKQDLNVQQNLGLTFQ